jgi:hypothetical protein
MRALYQNYGNVSPIKNLNTLTPSKSNFNYAKNSNDEVSSFEDFPSRSNSII